MGGGMHMLEKRKHNLILALFELGTTCSLLKQLVWLFIILLLTRRDVPYVAQRNFFFYVAVLPTLTLSTLKGFILLML